MQNLAYSVTVQLSKYLIIIMFAVYVLGCFRVFSKTPEKAEKTYRRQIGLVIAIQFLAMLILFLSEPKKIYIILYVGGLAFVIFTDLAYRYVYKGISRVLLNTSIMLVMIGFVELARLNTGYAIRQLCFASSVSFIGLFVPIIIEKFKYFNKLAFLYALVGIGLLGIVFIFGKEQYGAKNWIFIKGVGVQPSEFVKLLFVFFLAASLEKTKSIKRLLFVSVIAAVHVLILVFERDLGGAFILFITYLAMVYIATEKFAYLLLGTAMGSGAAVVAYKLFSHVRVRVIAFLNPWDHIENEGYQVAQSLFAIGTGGFLGMGFTEGLPDSIPVVSSDFIFAAISEEFGVFFGICLILLEISCFIMFINIALKMKRVFFKYTALGLAVEYIVQVLLNIGGVVKFIPSTGVTLPLISYGGSSIISTYLMIVIVQGMYSINFTESQEVLKHEEDA